MKKTSDPSLKTPLIETPKTRMSKDNYERCLKEVRIYLKRNDFIRNRDIRVLTGINYDQGIAFFNLAIASKKLTREGVGTGTRYVLYRKPKPTPIHRK
jgi:hypothetical protein